MPPSLACLSCILMALGSQASAFEVRATIKSVDAEQGMVQFTAGSQQEQQRNIKVAPGAKILDEKGEPIAAGLKAGTLKPGAVVVLTVERVGDRPLIRGI